MSVFKGTPGQWHSDRINNYAVWAPDCKIVDVMSVIQSTDYRVPEKDERAANGLLIAAAPDLLEALEGVCEGIVDLYSAISNGDRESGQRFAEADPKYIAARAAIARATGEA